MAGVHSTQSIRWYITKALAVLSVLTLMLVALCLSFVVRENRSELTQSADAYLQLMTGTLENQMSAAEGYITNEILNGEELHLLGFPADRTEAYLAGYRLKADFSNILSMGAKEMALYLYSQPNDLMMSDYAAVHIGSPSQTDVQRAALEEHLRSVMQQKTLDVEHWSACSVSGRTYWVRAVRYYGAWLAVAVDLDLQVDLETGLLAFSGPDGELLTGHRPTEGKQGKYVSLQRQIGDLTVEYYAPMIGGDLNLALLAVLGVATAELVTLIVVTLYLRKNVAGPLEQLIGTMERVSQGHLGDRVTDRTGSYELQLVQKSFNEMLEEIEKLKIEKYERQLETERYEMAALKMQIRPHFFLNTLKLIYAMVETGETGRIQQMILLLARHLRAVLDYNRHSNTLQEEAGLCQNYIELTNVGLAETHVYCMVEIENGLDDLEMPPLSLLSLVENSVKHAMHNDGQLSVHITAKDLPMETGRLVYIQVRDDGPGFPPEMMAALNGTKSKPEKHFGIQNIRRQCTLMYGPEFVMTFTNAPAGGAVVELYIPRVDSVQKESTADEIADRR